MKIMIRAPLGVTRARCCLLKTIQAHGDQAVERDRKTSVPRILDKERRLMCVDNNEDILSVLCELLTESGCRVLCESDAQRAEWISSE